MHQPRDGEQDDQHFKTENNKVGADEAFKAGNVQKGQAKHEQYCPKQAKMAELHDMVMFAAQDGQIS